MSYNYAVLLLGSNIGDQKKNLEIALQELTKNNIHIISESEFLYSEPVEFVSSNIFCNIAIRIEVNLSPIQLLNFLKNIERKMGRTVDSGGTREYTDRSIDIDIITYNNIAFSSKRLEIPHSRHLYEREFSRILLESLK